MSTPRKESTTSAELERAAMALRAQFVEEFRVRRDSSAHHFYKEMAFGAERYRVMCLHEHALAYRSEPDFDKDDLHATYVLRYELGQHLKLFCQELTALMKWFVENLLKMRRDIAWIEGEAEKVWPMLKNEYATWLQIACYKRPAEQIWQAPGWLDKWPADLPPKALLSAARGGRLDASRTAGVLNEVVERIKEPMERAQRRGVGDFRIGFEQEKEAARQAATAEPPVELQKKSRAGEQVHLTQREEKIWGVIQLGSSGSQYCRELENAGIRPPRTGIWKGCPAGTYPAAYRLGEPWRHRIQDEKSKIKRKAKLAETLAGE